MVYYIALGHNLVNEVQIMIQLFYPNLKYIKTDKLETGLTLISKIENNICSAIIYNNQKKLCEYSIKMDFYSNIYLDNEHRELKRFIKLTIYNLLSNVNNKTIPWGILTGIRPTKTIHEFFDKGANDDDIKAILSQKYLVSESKINLALKIAKAENQILSSNTKDTISIYIGIPFCATRCLYCSFTSFALTQYKNRVDDYMEALLKEIKFVSPYSKNFKIETIYIGGGTPTALNETQFELLLKYITEYFDLPDEFTVEAGRPDTITESKLKLMKKYKVSRISINPQTMNQKTLELIGRNHKVEDIIASFNKARQLGHQNINMDIILGLPKETLTDVITTLEAIKSLDPDSLTVHTLAVKRASLLKERLEQYELNNDEIENMLDTASKYASELNMNPYYMYRQKNMVGNFENIGYCKPNKECVYNIKIMEEIQTILALGAGASTKIIYPDKRIERIFNVKNVTDYIERIDEMIERKKNGLPALTEI